MGKKLSSKELELYKRCDEVLHYIWDPIGVAGAPGARDEYNSYLPIVFKLLTEGAEQDIILKRLNEFERKNMGLMPNRKRAKKAAGRLIDWRDWIFGDAF